VHYPRIKLGEAWSIYNYVAETVKYFNGYEYEIRYFKWLEGINKFITDTENEYFSILSSDMLQKLLPSTSRVVQMPNITVVFSS
jgi:hypothetical protein